MNQSYYPPDPAQDLEPVALEDIVDGIVYALTGSFPPDGFHDDIVDQLQHLPMRDFIVAAVRVIQEGPPRRPRMRPGVPQMPGGPLDRGRAPHTSGFGGRPRPGFPARPGGGAPERVPYPAPAGHEVGRHGPIAQGHGHWDGGAVPHNGAHRGRGAMPFGPFIRFAPHEIEMLERLETSRQHPVHGVILSHIVRDVSPAIMAMDEATLGEIAAALMQGPGDLAQGIPGWNTPNANEIMHAIHNLGLLGQAGAGGGTAFPRTHTPSAGAAWGDREYADRVQAGLAGAVAQPMTGGVAGSGAVVTQTAQQTPAAQQGQTAQTPAADTEWVYEAVQSQLDQTNPEQAGQDVRTAVRFAVYAHGNPADSRGVAAQFQAFATRNRVRVEADASSVRGYMHHDHLRALAEQNPGLVTQLHIVPAW